MMHQDAATAHVFHDRHRAVKPTRVYETPSCLPEYALELAKCEHLSREQIMAALNVDSDTLTRIIGAGVFAEYYFCSQLFGDWTAPSWLKNPTAADLLWWMQKRYGLFKGRREFRSEEELDAAVETIRRERYA